MNPAKLLRVTLASAVLLVATSVATAAVEPPVLYTVTVAQPQTSMFQVRMEISGISDGEFDVSMPVWTPGSYLVREYERHVKRFAAQDGAGRPLAWHKVDKNTWRVETDGAERVLVDYDVYAREPGIRWSFIYDDGGHVIGPSLFMHVVGAADAPATARFELPPGWRLNGAIAPSAGDPYTISADSYHELIDAPMLIGHFDEIAFEVGGIPHLIAILGPHNADLARLRDEFTRIIEVCSELFGGLPYDRYAFVFTTLTGGGGIEHANGTTIGLSGLDFQSEDGHNAVLGVTAHEFFHAWVVKRIQPPAFRPYNYEQENYTDALWFYEGFTSYYDDRILHRAGLFESPEDPIAMVTRYRSTPGHRAQSAADASFNAWIHLYRSDESFNNYHTDYYFKGSVIANLLELEIGHRTQGAKGVDDVMRRMWKLTVDEDAAFDAEAIRAICEEVAGSSFREFFDRYVFGTDDIPFEEFFRLAGYDLVVDEAATARSNQTGYMGVYLGESNGRVRLDGVVQGGPAYRSGLVYGDEIIAVDGSEIAGLDALREVLARSSPGTKLELLVLRMGRERTITLTLGSRSVPVYSLVEVEDPTDVQLAVRSRWRQTQDAER
ncbi:MAG: PDZ domain-containing protein [Gemmatimonadetes bacterium]|nr:PDZ domain-containing protein [Gemmatimonadota bacterium]NIO32447.1 PDZ domain-containing protein [Gemmatimonadota bacterium]